MIWQSLQKYMMPLIQEHASSYHLEGIKLLKLDADIKPDFNSFVDLFRETSSGFGIEPVDKEIDPHEYFSLIRQMKFPCIETMRTHAELFCASEPDFWHEAIGHLAPLCFQDIQEFYLDVADYMLAAKSAAAFKRRLALAWTLME